MVKLAVTKRTCEDPAKKDRVLFKNCSTILIPAFSIGRTQELLYEIEQIIHRQRKRQAAHGIPWGDLDIIADSSLANKFSEVYKTLASCWDRKQNAECNGVVILSALSNT